MICYHAVFTFVLYHTLQNKGKGKRRADPRERMRYMYESNYNYIDAETRTEKKKGGTGKTVALILAVALVGGASGFGGAYLQDRLLDNAVDQGAAQTVENARSGEAAVTVPTLSSIPSDDAAVTPTSNGSASGQLTTKQIIKKVTPSVVSIKSTNNDGSGGTGTGIVLSADGYIITNAHVVQHETTETFDNGGYNNGGWGSDDIFRYFFGGGNYRTVTRNVDKVTVVLSEDDSKEFEAEIIGADTASDLAVLKIDPAGITLTTAEFGDSDELEMGDTAVAVGYPLGLGLSVSQGIISGLNRTLDMERSTGGTASLTLIQTDTPINAGNSGGPLINAYGQVVGITSSKLVQSSIEGVAFAIPITDAMPIISDLMNQGFASSTTPQLGITGTNVNNSISRYYSLPVDKGVMVVSVSEGSGAEAAGIAAGDVIVAADGKDVNTMEDLTEIKSDKKIGDTMTITLARADGNIDVEVTLTGIDKPALETSDN